MPTPAPPTSSPAQAGEADTSKDHKMPQRFMSRGSYRFKINPENNFEDESDAFIWLWRPHSLIVMGCLVFGLAYFGTQTNDNDEHTNALVGIGISAAVFLIHAALQFPDGPFMRPHPIVWRLVLGVSILYLMFLVWILFQNPDQGRKALAFFDPELGKELPEKSYAEDCELYNPDHPSGDPWFVLWDNFDRFVLAHTIGWFVKGLAFRNLKLLLVCSFVFELLEYMLEFQLPNFGECWWDHWILDFVICNGTGIALGLWVCHLLEMRQYRWRGFKTIPTAKGKMMRAVSQFSPYAWQNFQWGPFKDLKHWLGTIFVIWMMLCADLNAFYLKTALWIPADNLFNLYRLLYAAMAAPVAVAETYAYITDRDCKKLGHQTTTVTLILVCEVLIAWKYGEVEPIMNANPIWLGVSGVTLLVLAIITGFYIMREICGKPFPEPADGDDDDSDSDDDQSISDGQDKKKDE